MSQTVITFAIYQRGLLLRRETIRRAVIRIGREAQNHLQLPDATVAKRHAAIEVAGPGLVTLVALAAEGVRVNGAWTQEAELQSGDRLRLGDTELVLEEIVARELEMFPAPRPRPQALSVEPETSFSVDCAAQVMDRAPGAGAAYALLPQTGALRADEVELLHQMTAEVQIAWGDNVLFVAHLSKGQSFCVGDDPSPAAALDFLVPSEKLGMNRLPLILSEGSRFWLVVPPRARGYVQTPDGDELSLDAARREARACEQVPGARRLPLTLGLHARLEFGDIVFRVAAVRPGKPAERGLISTWDTAVLGYFGLSALSIGGLMSSMAFLVPPLGMLDDEDTDQDQLYLLQHYLSASAEKETKQVPDNDGKQTSGSEGAARAEGTEGAMGKPAEAAREGRLALRGPAENVRELPRDRAEVEAERYGMIGMLRSGVAGDPDALLVPWGSDEPLGSDDVSAQGDLWSAQIGNRGGPGGLSLTGTGERGGGHSRSVGIDGIGTLGATPSGRGSALGFTPTGTHRTSVPRLRSGENSVSGRLPAEIVRRIVRQHHPRFRHCYERGLLTNPGLEGRVSVRFMIGRDGSVTHVADAGSDLPDPTVVRCVSGAFYDLSFPKPDGGVVTVVYPITLSPQ